MFGSSRAEASGMVGGQSRIKMALWRIGVKRTAFMIRAELQGAHCAAGPRNPAGFKSCRRSRGERGPKVRASQRTCNETV